MKTTAVHKKKMFDRKKKIVYAFDAALLYMHMMINKPSKMIIKNNKRDLQY